MVTLNDNFVTAFDAIIGRNKKLVLENCMLPQVPLIYFTIIQ